MIGLIGGSGLYNSHLLTDVEEVKAHTPYGSPSDLITIGRFQGKKIAFLPRHGKGHKVNPTNVNYHANIFALKELGVKKIIGVSAVGSLQENIHPGDLVIPDQFIDFTKQRKLSFYEGNQVAHISMAEPFCTTLRSKLNAGLKELNISHHEKGTYICIEGPRFSTKAESQLFRSWNAHVIGMTLVPEVILAREAEMCYATIALSTDYDSFKEVAVTAEEVIHTMKNNVQKAQQLLEKIIPEIDEKAHCNCHDALKSALM